MAQEFLEIGTTSESILAHVGIEVAGVDADGAAEADGGDAAALDELVDHRTAEVEDLRYFVEVEEARLHASVLCVSQAGGGDEAEPRYCGTLYALYRTGVLMSSGGLSME